MPKSSLDSLYTQVARKVLTESLSLKKGQSLTVETWHTGLSFARRVVIEARRIGAIPLVIFEDEDAYVEGAEVMPRDVLGQMGKHEMGLLSQTDAYVFIPGPVLGAYSHRMDRGVYLDSVKYNAAWYEAAAKARLRGARLTFGYISPEAEKVLGHSEASIVTHQLRAALADYAEIGRRGRKLMAELAPGSEVVLGTKGSRLKLTVKGNLEVEDGIVDDEDVANKSNVTYIPPGFLYAEVEPDSLSGTFSFHPTVTRFGLVADGTAEFDKGRLVRIKSRSSGSALSKVLEASSSRSASSISVGLNPLMGYGYARNVCCQGVVGLRVLGVDFTARRASIRAEGKKLVV